MTDIDHQELLCMCTQSLLCITPQYWKKHMVLPPMLPLRKRKGGLEERALRSDIFRLVISSLRVSQHGFHPRLTCLEVCSMPLICRKLRKAVSSDYFSIQYIQSCWLQMTYYSHLQVIHQHFGHRQYWRCISGFSIFNCACSFPLFLHLD